MFQVSKRFLAVSILFASLMSSPSYALLDVSALGGLTLSNMTESSQFATSKSMGVDYGFGGLVGFPLIPMLSVEGGLFYMRHKVNLTNIANSGNTGALNYNALSLPIMARVSPLPFLAVNAGFYFGLSATASVNIDANSVTTTLPPFDSNKDNGLIFGVSYLAPIAPAIKLRGSLFYELGLSNISNYGPDIKNRNFDILAGAMFDL